MNNLKETILERLINCGKKNKRLKTPVIILITLFLILFHGIRDFFMQFKLYPFRRRVLAGALSVCLVMSSMPSADYALSVLAAENSEDVPENGQEDIHDNTHDGIREIVSFTELPDEVKEQTVAVGTPLESLTLPDTLTAVCRMVNEKDSEDNTDSDKERDSEIEDKQPDEGKEENPEEDSDEGNEDESGGADNEGEGTGDESGDADIGGEGNEDESGDSSSKGEENEEAVEKQETFTVTLPEYYAMPDELPEIKDLFYEETVTIGGITWASQPEYDSDIEGVYLFTPVISDGTYTLAEDVKLPEITVMVAEAEIMLTEEELSDVSGSTEPVCGVISSDTTWGAGELSCGTLTVEEGVTLTLTGAITVTGDVTINGGGTIKRGDADAYFSVVDGNNIMGNIVVDGDLVESKKSMIMISANGKLTLDDGCVIENCKIIGAVEGGAINNRGTAIINNSIIRNCYSAVYGGAIGNDGAMVMNGSTIKDCQASHGGAIQVAHGSVNIVYATIEGCYASDSGGAIILFGGNIIIEDGMFINNRSGWGFAGWRGGCISNTQGKLYIYGGNFIENKLDYVYNSGSCISHMMYPKTVTEITGGNFEGNGRNAIYVDSAVSGNGNEFILSGDIHFGNGGDEDADSDGVEVRFEKYVNENGIDMEGKIWINGTLISTVPVYLPYNIPASEGLVIAEGKGVYRLSKNDAKKISVTNTSAPEEIWYVVLDEERNVLYLSQENPSYGYFVTYYSNGAEGTVTDGKEYTDMDNTVTVKDAVDLSYEGYVFDGWNTKADGTGISYKPGDTFNITSNIDLYAQWKLGGAKYTVEHYLQDINGDGYTRAEVDTEILSGTVEEEVKAIPKTYRGFTENTTHASRKESGVVASDGSLVLRLYYDRDVYHIAFNLNGGTGTAPEAQELRYGALLQEPGKPDKPGYSFLGWYMGTLGTEGKAWDFDKPVEENTEKKSETLCAGWVDDIAPKLMQAEFNEGYKSVHDWIIRKKDLIITVPIIEEGSGIKHADYVLTSFEKSDSENGPEQAQIIEEDRQTVAKITISYDFKGTVSMSCTDNAGNISAGKTLTSSGGGAAFIVEDNAPEITFSSKDGNLSDTFYGNVTVTVSVNDEGLQGNADVTESAKITGGIASVTYSIDSEKETAVEGKGFESGIVPSCDFSVEISGVGTHVLKVTATDNARNANTGQARIRIAQEKEPQKDKTPAPPVNGKKSTTLNTPEAVTEQFLISASAPQPLKTVDPAKETEPRTGDTSHVEVYATIAMITGLLYVLLYFTTGKNGMTQEEKEQFLSCLISWAKRGGKFRRLLATAAIFLFLVYYHSIGKSVVYDEKEIRV